MTSIACFYAAAWLVALVGVMWAMHSVTALPAWIGRVAAVMLIGAAGFAIAGVVRL